MIQKIRNEIERLKGIGGIVPLDNLEQKTGYESAMIDIEIFLDSLESEKPMQEELEEEIAGMYQALFGTDVINRKEMLYLDTFEAIARHFAQWGAEHASGSSEIPNDLEESEKSTFLESEVEKWMQDNSDDNGFFNQVELARHFYELGGNYLHVVHQILTNNPNNRILMIIIVYLQTTEL